MNSKVTIYEEMVLSRFGLRAPLAGRYEWFTHDAPLYCLPSIRVQGLLPQAVSNFPPELGELIGSDSSKIICLHPLGADLRPSSSSVSECVRLAISTSDLPNELSLDWSYAWRLVCAYREQDSESSFEKFVLRMAQKLGSLACYQPIDLSKLRIRAKDELDQPETWAALGDISDEHVFLIG